MRPILPASSASTASSCPDAADLAGLQRLDRLGDREIGLAGACRPEGQHEVVVVDRRHQLGLTVRFRLKGLQIGLVAVIVRGVGRPAGVGRKAAYL